MYASKKKNKGNIAEVKRSGNIITLKYPDAKKTYTVTIDCEDYVLREFFGDDIDLLKYLEVVKLNRFCITSISKKGYIDNAEILKEFPNIKEDAFNGLDQESQKLMLEKFGSIDNFWEALKNSHR